MQFDMLLAFCLASAARGMAVSWQNRLDRAVLGVDISPKARRSNLRRALADREQITTDVKYAVKAVAEQGFGKGHVIFLDTLVPKGTTARADLEALQSLRKQVGELPGISVPGELQRLVQQARKAGPPDPAAGPRAARRLASLATDRELRRELANEALNAFRTTPKGLQTPKFTRVRKLEGGVELRKYEPFTLAKTAMSRAVTLDGEPATSPFSRAAGAAGFDTLAKYLFGENGERRSMAMTMPVETRAGGDAPGMAFVLPRDAADVPPAPLGAVTIEKVPARLVAVKRFPGLVTDGEVERQRAAVAEALARDGGVAATDAGEFSVLQYNSPITLPWRRRNELAVVVTETGAVPPPEAEETSAEATSAAATSAAAGATAAEREDEARRRYWAARAK